MHDAPIQSLAIVGGGTAGWMAAAVLSVAFGPRLSVTLIESEEIGTVGVGEATIPQIHHINAFLGLDEIEFIRATQASFKLGIEFADWGALGDRYIHAFGDIGAPVSLAPFHHYWLRARAKGEGGALWAYSINAEAARLQKFARLERLGASRLPGLKYAYHFDAGLYARYLRVFAEKRGVRRVEGRITGVELDPETGAVARLVLAGGAVLAADFFIDCSGFAGLLIEEALGAGYEDWSRFLPADRALAVPSAHGSSFRPYTQSTADAAGWRWRIPLQHRVGNGHVFCSAFMSDDAAREALLKGLEGEALAEPRLIRFTTGMRKRQWVKNCLALGLASGFLEPLESTSIHLIQSGLSRFLATFPNRQVDEGLIAEFNRQSRFEFERVRDFIILHYHATARTDTPFWRHCREMAVPDALQSRMALFAETGRVFRENEELFTENGWLQVMIGQGVTPRGYHPLADALPEGDFQRLLGDLRQLVRRSAADLPAHQDFIAKTCAAPV